MFLSQNTLSGSQFGRGLFEQGVRSSHAGAPDWSADL